MIDSSTNLDNLSLEGMEKPDTPEPSQLLAPDRINSRARSRSRERKQTGLDILKSKVADVTDHVKQQMKSVIPTPPKRRARSSSKPRQVEKADNDNASDRGSQSTMEGVGATGRDRELLGSIEPMTNYEESVTLEVSSQPEISSTTPTTKRRYIRQRRQIPQIPNPITSLRNQVEDFKDKLRRSRTPPRRPVNRSKIRKSKSAGCSRAGSTEPEDYANEENSENVEDQVDKENMNNAEIGKMTVAYEAKSDRPELTSMGEVMTISLEQMSIKPTLGSRLYENSDRIEQERVEDNRSPIPSGPVVYTAVIFPTDSEQEEGEAIVGRLTMEPQPLSEKTAESKTRSGKSLPPTTLSQRHGEAMLGSEEISLSSASLSLARALLQFSSKSLRTIANYIETVLSEDPDLAEEQRASKQALLAILLVLVVGFILASKGSGSSYGDQSWYVSVTPPHVD